MTKINREAAHALLDTAMDAVETSIDDRLAESQQPDNQEFVTEALAANGYTIEDLPALTVLGGLAIEFEEAANAVTNVRKFVL